MTMPGGNPIAISKSQKKACAKDGKASEIGDPGAELGIFTIPNETLFVSCSPPQVLCRLREKDYVRGFFQKLRSPSRDVVR